MQTEKESFNYTYSAKEQEELKKIQQKYQPKEETKMDLIRRLDAGVTKKATMVSILLGILGSLILGSGMSFLMTELGDELGMAGGFCMVSGIVLGIAGIVLISLAYPVYQHMVKKEREKIAPQILKLTEELMK